MRMTELKRLRLAAGLTREELAVKAGVSWYAIRSHELGLVNGTETKTAEALAVALGIETRSLFFPTSTGTPVNEVTAA